MSSPLSFRPAPARHRDDARSAAGFAVLARTASTNAGGMGRQAAVFAAASGLVLTSGVAANAADLQPQRDVAVSSITLTSARPAVVASDKASVSFAMTPVKVTAKPVVVKKAPAKKAPAKKAPVDAPVAEAPAAAPVEAPVVEAPVAAPAVEAPVVEAPAAIASPAVAAPIGTPVVQAPVAQAPVVQAPAVQASVAAAPVAPAPVVAPRTAKVVPASTPAPAPSSGVAATIAAAAKGQLGVTQDCTRLASNSLAAAGINFHGWPAGYLSLGRTVGAGEAIPGDLIYYADGGMGMAHIAVYIGGGQAVHGGFNGNTTVIAPAELGSGGVYIRVGG
ncbi:NlpC/P60 family protein [Arthrobacter pityocampae]|uniref:NlpC/P60 family protein n=1 Tax=Arthrobacter pityocampae TaxID=547334 RepID=UPI003736BEF0